ncbi:unnamed protein product, partial [Ceratitis capitata]
MTSNATKAALPLQCSTHVAGSNIGYRNISHNFDATALPRTQHNKAHTPSSLVVVTPCRHTLLLFTIMPAAV